MRTLLSSLALLSLTALPVVAHADTLDLFTLTEGTQTVTFTVAGSPVPVGPNPPNFVLKPVEVTTNGVLSSDYLEFFTTAGGGGVQIGVPDVKPVLFDLFGATLFSGDTTAPTFLLGTYSLQDALTTPNAPATLTISSAAAVTPEPSSLVLLGTGALGLLGVVRRRLASR